MESYDPKSGLVAVVGVVSSVVLVAAIVVLQALYYRAQDKENVRKAVFVPPEVQSVQAEQLGQLEGYRVVDPEREVVAIPIDRAMELLIAEQGGRVTP